MVEKKKRKRLKRHSPKTEPITLNPVAIEKQNDKNLFTKKSERLYWCDKKQDHVNELGYTKADRMLSVLATGLTSKEALELLSAAKKSKASRRVIKILDESIYISQRY